MEIEQEVKELRYELERTKKLLDVLIKSYSNNVYAIQKELGLITGEVLPDHLSHSIYDALEK